MPPLPEVTFATLRSQEGIAFGLIYLPAVLRSRGARPTLIQAADADELERRFRARPTPVLAFSATTGLHRLYAGWARRLKARHQEGGQDQAGPQPDQRLWDVICE